MLDPKRDKQEPPKIPRRGKRKRRGKRERKRRATHTRKRKGRGRGEDKGRREQKEKKGEEGGYFGDSKNAKLIGRLTCAAPPRDLPS